MAGTQIDMSKVKQLLQLKQSSMSNRQIAKTLGISRDKANEFVKQAESDPLGIVDLLKLVKVFVKGNQVAVHKRVRGYGYTSLDEHLASNTLAFTKRSANYYIDRAKSVSEALCALIEGMFASSRANCPPEYYYKTCDMMLRLQRDYNPSYFDRACEICLENSLFTGKKLENVIKTLMQATPEDNWLTAPDPTDHINMRGSLFFQ